METQTGVRLAGSIPYLFNLVVYYSSIVLCAVQCDRCVDNLEARQWGLFLHLMNAIVNWSALVLRVIAEWKSEGSAMRLSVFYPYDHWTWMFLICPLRLASGWYGTSGRDGPSRTYWTEGNQTHTHTSSDGNCYLHCLILNCLVWTAF